MDFIQKFVFFVFLVFGSVSQAEVYDVSTTAEFREALASAAEAGGDNTIRLAAGTYSTQDDGEGPFEYTSNQGGALTILGSGNTKPVLDAVSSDRVLIIYAIDKTLSLSIENLSFQNGITDSYDGGAAVFVRGEYDLSGLLITDSSFLNNQALNGSGGAIKYWGSGLVVKNSVFNSNIGAEGGAIYAPGVNVSGSTFTNNHSLVDQNTWGQNGGGAIGGLSNYSLSVIQDSRFISNYASATGGAIHWNTSNQGKIIGNIFRDNVAGDKGGAIGTTNALNTSIENNLFQGNSSTNGGAALHMRGTPYLSVLSNVFLDNSSESNGPGFYADHSGYGGDYPIYISNNLFKGSSIRIGYWDSPVRVANNIFLNDALDFSLEGDGILYIYNNYIDTSRLENVLVFQADNIFEDVEFGFSDQANNDFSLTESSDLIDRGLTDESYASISSNDMSGHQRISGLTVDIGPYEYDQSGIPDSDGDGINDNIDNCPSSANDDQADFDSDGEGDVCDSDDDNDGTNDEDDAFPIDDTESLDTDGDGIGNNEDEDDDGDGFLDASDPQPIIANVFAIDSDGDGVADSIDDYPTDATKQFSSDGDFDGDGFTNDEEVDYCTNPFDKNSQPDVGGLSVWMLYLGTQQQDTQ